MKQMMCSANAQLTGWSDLDFAWGNAAAVVQKEFVSEMFKS